MVFPDTKIKSSPIFYFKEHWLADCPEPWQIFVHVTRGTKDSDEFFAQECKRYGIIHSYDSDSVYFESEEAVTNFLLAFALSDC